MVKALIKRLLGELDHGVFADRERPWRERVEPLVLELRARLPAHTGAVSLMVGRPMKGAKALALDNGSCSCSPTPDSSTPKPLGPPTCSSST